MFLIAKGKGRLKGMALWLLCAGALLTAGVRVGGGTFNSVFELNQKGVQALEAGRYEEAVNYLSEADREGDNTTVRRNLSAAYNKAAFYHGERGDFDKARDYMQKACALFPGEKQLRTNYAHVLTNEGFRRYNAKRTGDIEWLLRESLQYDDTVAGTHILLGQLYYDRDEYRHAKAEWQKAAQLDPGQDDVKRKLEKLGREMADENQRFDQTNYHFKVRYEGTDMWTASRDVLGLLESAYVEAGRKFGVFPDQPLTVIIYTQEKFRSVTGADEWSAGLYDGKIRLRRGDVEGDKPRLKQIVYHEYMHAFVHYLAGNNVPVWLNEGIAQCYENMPAKAALTGAEKRLLGERLSGGALGLDAVEPMFRSRYSRAEVSFAYAYAKAFVCYLIDRGWDYSIRNLLEECKKGTAVNDAFNRVYFRSLDMMHDDWKRTGLSL